MCGLILTTPEGFSPLYPYKKCPIYISPSGCSAYHFVPLNEEDSILVTLLGISIEAKLVQPLKALLPILVTLLGIVIEVKPVQPSYLQLIGCYPVMVKAVER